MLTTKRIRIFFHCWRAVNLMLADTIFQNFSFSLVKFKSCHWQQECIICFPWWDRFTLFMFEKKSAKYPSLWKSIVCQSFFQVITVIWKTAQLTTQTMGQWSFSEDNHCIPVCSSDVSYALPILIHRLLKRYVGTSLVVLWLRLSAPSAGCPDSILGGELDPTRCN